MIDRNRVVNLILVVVLFFVIVWSGCEHEPYVPPVDTNTTTSGPSEPCDPDVVYFNQEVLPVLVTNCAYSGCHDATSAEEGVILDNYKHTKSTGGVRPKEPNKSKLYEVLVDKEDDIMPPPPEKPLAQQEINLIYRWIAQGALDLECMADCDTTQFTWSVGVQPIVQKWCSNCHSGSNPDGGVSLTTYDQVKVVADKGSLLGTMQASGGYPVMPPGGKLGSCEIEVIRKWIASGANND